MRVQAGRAGGDDRQVRALEAELDRDVARDHVDDRGRHEERRDAARAALRELGLRCPRSAAGRRCPSRPGTPMRSRLLVAELVVGRQAGVAAPPGSTRPGRSG